MKKVLTIARRELLNLVGKASFWISLILVPVLIGGIVLIIAISSGAATAASAANRAHESKVQGIIDESGLLRAQPALVADTPEFRLFESEAQANAALADKSISAYYIVAADFLSTGTVRYVANQFSPFDVGSRTDAFETLIRTALLNGDAARVKRFEDPLKIGVEKRLAPDDGRPDLPFSPVPIAAAVMFMGTLLGASSYLMQSVSTEKENRIMEVLVSSVSPLELLSGKILGLGMVGLLQMIMGLGSVLGALPALARVPQLQPYLGVITPEAIAWSFLFFLIGYVIYAALMAGVGALMPGMKEASSYAFLVMLPLLIPLYLNSVLTSQPNGTLATIISMIPFSTPVAMPIRLLSGTVPIWQPILAVILMLLSALACLVLSARVFRAQSLLRGSKPTLRDVAQALRA
jgi:ABC-2 type transport system permease protein